MENSVDIKAAMQFVDSLKGAFNNAISEADPNDPRIKEQKEAYDKAMKEYKEAIDKLKNLKL